ncbi:MAG: LysR family transcriptional regulator [Roseococcus sp.]|nr:LysR family transcriptional regulator [Roseococcus sp.]
MRALIAFEATARLGSMTLAAAELGLTPSAVSHRIATLEAHFGQVLFRRGATGIAPTAQAALLARRIGGSLSEIATACVEFTAGEAPLTLDVHMPASLTAKWLRPRLGRFLAGHADVALRVIDTAGPPTFRPGRDLVVLYGSDAPPGAEPLLRERVRPLCAPALCARLGPEAKARDLLALPLLHSRTAVGWPDWCRAQGLPAPPPGGLRFDRSHIAIDAACEGQGLVLESDLLTEAERRDGRLVEPLPQEAAMDSVGYALLAPAAPLGPAMAAFIAWLRAEAKS